MMDTLPLGKKLGYEVFQGPRSSDVGDDDDDTWYGQYMPNDEDTYSEEYIIMTTADLVSQNQLKAVNKSKKSFIFVQPCVYPKPWGTHINFTCTANKDVVKELDKMDNVYLWTFADIIPEYYTQWTKKIHTIPLAFDSINYNPQVKEKYKQFDISFVGGWADNGFNEKKQIIIDIFSKFKNSGLRCGFFVNKKFNTSTRV